MPVTIQLYSSAAIPIHFDQPVSQSDLASYALRESDAALESAHDSGVLASSMQVPDATKILPCKNGFVDACIDAYIRHHCLVLRPDDVWLAIVAQLNIFLKGNAHELVNRLILPHDPEFIVDAPSVRWERDYPWISNTLIDVMSDALMRRDDHSWIMPKFSTTNRADLTCSAIMMLGSTKNYLRPTTSVVGGIPNVTLRGEQSDYLRILRRLDKIASLGDDAQLWANMLKPIIGRFVQAFRGDADKQFWKSICHYENDAIGKESYNGWITAFCPFDQYGQWQLRSPVVDNALSLQLDGISYPVIATQQIPLGFFQMELQIRDSNNTHPVCLVGGLMAQKVLNGLRMDRGIPRGFTSNTALSPHPVWFIVERPPVETPLIEDFPQKGYRRIRENIDWDAATSVEVSTVHPTPAVHIPWELPVAVEARWDQSERSHVQNARKLKKRRSVRRSSNRSSMKSSFSWFFNNNGRRQSSIHTGRL